MSLNDEIKLQQYDRTTDALEHIHSSVNNIIKHINDTTPKIIKNANKKIKSLDKIKELSDNFMMEFTPLKI